MALPEIIKDIEARVKDTGDIMTGNLYIDTDACPGVFFRAPNGGYSNLFKNNSATVEDGTHIRDTIASGAYVTLLIRASDGIASALRVTDGTSTCTILHTGNMYNHLDGEYVNIAGDTMLGALNFANGTWNKIGDDVQIGDANVAGTLCIQGLNGPTALEFRKYNDLTNFGRLIYDGNNFIFERNVYLQHATPSFNIYDTTSARLFQLYTDDNENGLILNWKSSGNFTQIALLAEKYGTNDIVHLYRYVNGAAEEYNVLHSGNYFNYTDSRYFTKTEIQNRGLMRNLGFQSTSSNWASCLSSQQFSVYTNWWDSAQTYMPYIYGSCIMMPHLDANYRSFLYLQCNAPKAWVGWVQPNVTQTPTWKYLWGQGDAVTSAVWNDYAECREADTIEPGYVLVETGNDTLTKSTERLSPFAGVSSDTWGFSQGETDKAKTPIAVAGRVLVYPYQDRNNYKPGDCVCAAPDGKVDIMTREEIIQYPDRIVGTVSSVPTYDKWGGGETADREPVDVNGRIWIKVQ